jgi:hypothetical protein
VVDLLQEMTAKHSKESRSNFFMMEEIIKVSKVLIYYEKPLLKFLVFDNVNMRRILIGRSRFPIRFQSHKERSKVIHPSCFIFF